VSTETSWMLIMLIQYKKPNDRKYVPLHILHTNEKQEAFNNINSCQFIYMIISSIKENRKWKLLNACFYFGTPQNTRTRIIYTNSEILSHINISKNSTTNVFEFIDVQYDFLMLAVQDEYKHQYQYQAMFRILMNHLNIHNKHVMLVHQNRI
jgi:hypothetical protein